MLALFSHAITQVIGSYGYLAVFVLMAVDSACVPIPSEVVLTFAGALTSSTAAAHLLGDPSKALGLPEVLVVAAAGSLAGSSLAYWVGAAGGRPLIDRFGRYLLLRPHEVDRAHEWFERHGEAAVFWSRMIPLARAFISLPAGIARMNFVRFALYSLLGIAVWTIGLVLAGHALGQSWTTIERFMAPISIVVAAALIGALAWWIVKRRRSRIGEPADLA